MNTKNTIFAGIVALAMVAPMGLSYVLANVPPSPPADTWGCNDAGTTTTHEYHIWWLSGNVPKTLAFTQGIDTCSTDTTTTSEVAGAIGGATLFAWSTAADRTVDHGTTAQGGGVSYCYTGATVPGHHGNDHYITVADSNLGNEVGFTVFSDWSRGTDNGVPSTGPGNTPDSGTQTIGPGAGRTDGCGDGLIEPCPPGYDDRTAPGQSSGGYIVVAGCNNDDRSYDQAPGHLACDQDPLLYDPNDSTIFLGTGALIADITGLTFPSGVPSPDITNIVTAAGNDVSEVLNEVSWATGFPGAVVGGANGCNTGFVLTSTGNTWYSGGSRLGLLAGADGTVGLFITTAFSNQVGLYGTVISTA